MSNQKKLFHDLISEKVLDALVGINSDPASPKAIIVTAFLDILQEGKMWAKDARKVADDLKTLPSLLIEAGQKDLAGFAMSVLNDLSTREDERKSVGGAVLSAPQ